MVREFDVQDPDKILLPEAFLNEVGQRRLGACGRGNHANSTLYPFGLSKTSRSHGRATGTYPTVKVLTADPAPIYTCRGLGRFIHFVHIAAAVPGHSAYFQ